MNQTSATTVGILLPEFESEIKGSSLEQLMHERLKSPQVSRGARELLQSANPSRRRADGNQQRLIAVEGCSLPKDPFTEAINRFAKGQGWSRPSLEDALRVFPLITPYGFNPELRFLVVLHEPVRGQVLGFTFEKNRVILSAHKAEPREGWFCQGGGFIFRST